MNIYNGIYIINRDDGFIDDHIASMRSLGKPMTRCLYYSADGHCPLIVGEHERLNSSDITWHPVPCAPGRDNMCLKTYGMFKHALTIPDWTHFFKTDVNVRVTAVKWNAVERSDFAGCLVTGRAGRTYKNEEREPLLREPYQGRMARLWCGGSAYIVSRKLAMMVVQCGAWAARGHYAEDQMVAAIAEENNIAPVAAVAYADDQMSRGFTFP